MSDDHVPPNQRALDEAINAFQRMSVPERPPDADLLNRLAVPPETRVLPLTRPSQRRFYMRPAFQFAMAAAVLAAVCGWLLFSGASSVALADVIEAAGKHRLVKYQMTQTTEDKDNALAGIGTSQSLCYADLKAPRFRTELKAITTNGVIDYTFITVQDNTKDQFLSVITERFVPGTEDDPAKAKDVQAAKQMGLPRKEARLTRVPLDGAKKAKTFLENLRELEKHKDAVAVKGKLDGRETLHYRIQEEGKTTQLWVDAKTKLPVRLEYEILDGAPNIPRNTLVFTDFEWDPDVKGFKGLDELFSVAPPEGHTVKDEK